MTEMCYILARRRKHAFEFRSVFRLAIAAAEAFADRPNEAVTSGPEKNKKHVRNASKPGS